jgi:hypothetical protein
VLWEPVEQGHVKLDDKTPITWNLLQPNKKTNKKAANLVLVLLGRRYLMLDMRAMLVYAVVPGDLQAQGNNFESDDLAQESRLIPSADWLVRDVGPEELIRVRLGDYDRVLQVELSHPNLSLVR